MEKVWFRSKQVTTFACEYILPSVKCKIPKKYFLKDTLFKDNMFF